LLAYFAECECRFVLVRPAGNFEKCENSSVAASCALV
jgi:hypothetical protein